MSEMERWLRESAARGQLAPVAADAQLEQTLRNLMYRIALILETEGCVFLLFDPASGELRARPPAVGLEEDQLGLLRIPTPRGLSGDVFRRSKPVLVPDVHADPRTVEELRGLPHICNTVTVPLRVEVDDPDEDLIIHRNIGVLHAFNKNRGLEFNAQDVRLLTVMSRTLAVILYHAVVYEVVSRQTGL